MAEALEQSALERWRNDPAEFITEVLAIQRPASRSSCCDAEKEFLKCAYALDADGRLLYPEMFRSAKEIRQDRLRGDGLLSTVLIFGGPFAEGYVVANDENNHKGAYSKPSAG